MYNNDITFAIYLGVTNEFSVDWNFEYLSFTWHPKSKSVSKILF